MLTLEDIVVQIINEFVKPKFNTNPEFIAFNYHGDSVAKWYQCSAHILISDFDPDDDGIEPHFFNEEFGEYLKSIGLVEFGSFHYYEFDAYGLQAVFYVNFSTVSEFMNITKLKNKDPEKIYEMSKYVEV